MREGDGRGGPPAPVTDSPWAELRRFTAARIALGRAGTSLPTRELLRFQLDHARATDAVHRALDVPALCTGLQTLAIPDAARPENPVVVHSRARDRTAYLQRPDLGRQLDEASWQQLHEYASADATAIDLAIVIADGLSSIAVQQHAALFLSRLLALLHADEQPWRLAPPVIACQGRVAIGDDIGESLRARAVLVCIGERPGLTAADSMGAYLTWAPRRGIPDASRNCISNIRPGGLGSDDASARAFYLLREARRLQLTGIGLKDRSGHAAEINGPVSAPQATALLGDYLPPGDSAD